MSVITTILFWLSSGMLIPVIIALLLAFVWSLVMIGDLYGRFTQRVRSRGHVRMLLERAGRESIRTMMPENMLPDNSDIRNCLAQFSEARWKPVHCEKILADYELAMKKSLETASIMIRVGPMLGLMGTLIPMGPALVGLAAGDIQSMAFNVRVAFSTTVVGLFAGGAGFVVHLFRQRWHREDGETLQYLYDLSRETEALS